MRINRTRTTAVNATLISASILAAAMWVPAPAYADPAEDSPEQHECTLVETCLYLTKKDFDENVPAVVIAVTRNRSVTVETKKYAMIRQGRDVDGRWYVGLSKKGADGNCKWESLLSGSHIDDPEIDGVGKINIVGATDGKKTPIKKSDPAPCP
ncbi:hypothetical protein [Nocardia sp. NPDC050175]|uniref:hypothetical protein n=1 Tax=Nocardia sp. NPDC050175 TaxID=3364317 RepID=UPI00379C1B3B